VKVISVAVSLDSKSNTDKNYEKQKNTHTNNNVQLKEPKQINIQNDTSYFNSSTLMTLCQETELAYDSG